jgi:hypothetical protein
MHHFLAGIGPHRAGRGLRHRSAHADPRRLHRLRPLGERMNLDHGVARLDIHDDADMAVLIRTGLIWRGGPKTVARAVQYLRANPSMVNDKVPAAVLAELADKRP